VSGDGNFEPVRFSGFPEMKEAFITNNLQGTFILAPLAMKLREDGQRVKIVYLGHRDGTTMMVHKDSDITDITHLRGKKIAIPNRYSNQHLILFKAFRDRGMNIKSANLVEMPPPDMPAALQSRSVDAIIAGEPIMARTELDGYGRILFKSNDVWPEFISCVLCVREDVIAKRRDEVQLLVDGIARSGLWLDQDRDAPTRKDKTPNHRMQAAQFVSKHYYNYDPKLLAFVLSKPPDRVKYTNLTLRKKDFEEIQMYARLAGLFKGNLRFEDYADPSFVPEEAPGQPQSLKPWQWEATK
jgi:NitT/TauT family transport system substrate-binding protein